MQRLLYWRSWWRIHVKQVPMDWLMDLNRKPLMVFLTVVAFICCLRTILWSIEGGGRGPSYLVLPLVGVTLVGVILAVVLVMAKCPQPRVTEVTMLSFSFLILATVVYASVVVIDDLEARMRAHAQAMAFWKTPPAILGFPIVVTVVFVGASVVMDISTLLLCQMHHGDPFQLGTVANSGMMALASIVLDIVQMGRLRAVYDAQQALSVEMALMESIIAMMSDAIVWLSDDCGTVLRTDPRFAMLIGRSTEGEQLGELLPEEEHERVQDCLGRAKAVPVLLPTTLVSDAGMRIPVDIFVVGNRGAHKAGGQQGQTPEFLIGIRFASRQGTDELGNVDMRQDHAAMLARRQADRRADSPPEEELQSTAEIRSTSMPETTSTDRMFAGLDVERWLQGTPEDIAAELRSGLEKVDVLGQKEHWLIGQQDLELEPDELLGAGAFGFVVGGWLHGSPVAVKVVRRLRDARVQHIVALANEIRVLRHIKHPNVALFHGACMEPQQCEILLILERVKGPDLFRYVIQHTADAEVYGRFQLLLDVAVALRYLHAQSPQIVHGDLKGSNVLVEAAVPRAKLVDFGLSRLLTRGVKPLGGSLMWMAPELIIRPAAKPGTSADVFSFGRLAYMVLTCRKPLEGLRPAAVKEMARAGLVHGLAWEEGRPLQRECAALCRGALSLAPEERPSMRQVHQEASAWELPDLEERMPAVELARAARGPADAPSTSGAAAALAGIRHSLGDALATTRGQAAAEAGAPQSPPAAAESSVPPLVLPDLLQTDTSAKTFLLLDTMRQWNFPAPPGACCKYHAAIADLRRMAQLLMTTNCMPDYEPYGAFQCHKCGMLDFEVHSGCPICERFADGLPSLATIQEDVPEPVNFSRGSRLRCSL